MSRKNVQRGATYLEVLVAALLLSMVGTAAFRSWGIAGRVATAKRVTEMCAFVGTSEMERLKAQTYNALPDATTNSWYDKYGTYVSTGTQPANAVYKAVAVVGPIVNRDSVTNTEDLRQITITVSNVNNASTSGTWTCQTLITFDGI